jgi:hypothetical protein
MAKKPSYYALKHKSLTFQVFRCEQQIANMVFLDKLFDLWSNRRSIEAYDEHLALSRSSLVS